MLAIGLLPLVAFGLLALLPMLETSDPVDDGMPEDDMPIDGEGDGDETPDGETPDEGGDPDAAASTVVTITDAEGETREIEFSEVDFGDTIPVVEGTELRDVVEASETPSVPVQINTLGGDDTVDFGFSTSVDPGEGTDVLSLTITADALANGDLEEGVDTFDDPLDALAIEIEDEAVGFVHEIRVESSNQPDDATRSETETLYYVLSASETLTVDQTASEAAGEIVFEGEAQVLTQIDLGTLTRVTGEDEDGTPTETITGSINEDPTILVNRDVSSEQTLTLPTTEAPQEDMAEDDVPADDAPADEPAADEPAADDGEAVADQN